jgi:predicted amidohydrolase
VNTPTVENQTAEPLSRSGPCPTVGLAIVVALLVLAVTLPLQAQPTNEIRLERAEAWAPHPIAAPKTVSQTDGMVVIEANGTRTCCGGCQFVYTSVRGGQSYRLRARVEHRDLVSPWDSLLAVALWDKWDPAQTSTRTIPYDHLLPKAVGSNGTDFECVVTAPEGATRMTIRYVFRWSEHGFSKWSAPQVEPVTVSERKPVKICVVSANPKSSQQTRTPPLAPGLGVSREVEQSVNLWASLILEACQRHPQLIVIPETVIGGKDPLKEGAVTVPGPATRPFEQIAREHQVYLVLGLWERQGDAFYNSAVLVDPQGKVAGVYRKAHLATSEGWSGVSAGTDFPVFDTEFGRVGSMICMDSMLSEPARMLALNGAEFVCLPIKGDLRADRLTPGSPIFNEDRWKAIMRTRALDNQVCLIVARNEAQGSCIVNRCGDIVAWNEGDQNIIEATIPPERIRYWAGGELAEVTFLLRRPRLYDVSTDESKLWPLPPRSARPFDSTVPAKSAGDK